MNRDSGRLTLCLHVKIKIFLNLNWKECNLGIIWFQQDGAKVHAAKVSITKLREIFDVSCAPRLSER